jgi:hypothetical protein
MESAGAAPTTQQPDWAYAYGVARDPGDEAATRAGGRDGQANASMMQVHPARPITPHLSWQCPRWSPTGLHAVDIGGHVLVERPREDQSPSHAVTGEAGTGIYGASCDPLPPRRVCGRGRPYAGRPVGPYPNLPAPHNTGKAQPGLAEPTPERIPPRLQAPRMLQARLTSPTRRKPTPEGIPWHLIPASAVRR